VRLGALLRIVAGHGLAPIPPADQRFERMSDANRAPDGRGVILPLDPVAGAVEGLHRHAHAARPQGRGRALQAVEAAVVEREPVVGVRLAALAVPLVPAHDLDGRERRLQNHVVLPGTRQRLDGADCGLHVLPVLEDGADVLLREADREWADELLFVDGHLPA